MAAMSDYLENKLIDFVFRGQSYTPPANTWLGLLTTATNDTNSGQVEVSGGGYSRVVVPSNLLNWSGTQSSTANTVSSGTSGTTYNLNSIAFPTPTGANWGVITAFGMFDASSGGNLLFYGNLTLPKTVNDGDAAPTFSAQALSIQLDN
jgi:hypothetical protein